MNRIVGIALTGLSLSLLAVGKAEAGSFTFNKIVDTNTAIPGGTGNFGTLTSISLDNGDVAFLGLTSPFGNQQFGVYTSIGGVLSVVADRNTAIPGDEGNNNFVFFDDPLISNGNVAFTGTAFATGTGGIYTSIGGVLSVFADEDTAVPSSGGSSFRFFDSISLDNENVAFTAQFLTSGGFGSGEGIYTNVGGTLNLIAQSNTTPIPGGTGVFDTPRNASLDNGSVAFDNDFSGIYTTIGGTLNVLADQNTPVPGGTGNFTLLSSPSLDEDDVAFRGANREVEGIYASIDGILNVVADTNTPIPEGTGNFGAFGTFLSAPSLDGENVAFVGSAIVGFTPDDDPERPPIPILQSGVYTNIGGTLAKVIVEGDLLDGKEVDRIQFGSEGLSGNQIAFAASFTDGSQGIYVAVVPEPSSVLATLVFGGFGAGWMLKRRREKLARSQSH